MLGMEGLRMAVTALWSHKLRSTLTILGVVIGIGSVLAVTSLGAAFEDTLVAGFDDLDNRQVLVTVNAADQGGVGGGPPSADGGGRVFTQYDIDNLATIEHVERVEVAVDWPVAGFEFEGRTIIRDKATATGADNDDVADPGDYATGGPFHDGAKELVLGWNAARFFSDDPESLAGKTVTVRLLGGGNDTLTITGVLSEQGGLFSLVDNEILVPVDPFYTTTVRSPHTGQEELVYEGLGIFTSSTKYVNAVRDDVIDYFEGDSDAKALLADGLEILAVTPDDIVDQIGQAFDQATLFIAGIAGVSLLVGGIMIGTIMLISVTERTKEIGMMKAIGALDREILWTFLLEAALVGLIGSIFGIALGLGAGAVLTEALFDSEETPVSFAVPWDWLGWSLLVGIGVGIVSGFLPARRATKIQPVEALSYE